MKVALMDYNCAGYALGIKHWIEFETFCVGDDVAGDETDVLYDMIDEIENKFCKVTIVNNPYDISKETKVIGVRLSVNDDDVAEDFHFIVRKSGRWYHKPGGSYIRAMKKADIYKPWPRWNGATYNSDILWFTPL